MKVLFEAIREWHALAAAVEAQPKPNRCINNYEFCRYPSIEARFQLMEAAYREDMEEVYQRLAKLEAKCLNL